MELSRSSQNYKRQEKFGIFKVYTRYIGDFRSFLMFDVINIKYPIKTMYLIVDQLIVNRVDGVVDLTVFIRLQLELMGHL